MEGDGCDSGGQWRELLIMVMVAVVKVALVARWFKL